MRPHGFAGVLSEYDGNNNLLRKYIYGPGIDQPVCMIEQAESETYYYHFDALGSVVALSDSSGDTVQTYQYSVFGEVWASDIDNPNPYMFAGRRFDKEIGQYYNRTRYYNPFAGRFLQADPAAEGMNLYAYCGNNPICRVDPMGLRYDFVQPTNYNPELLHFGDVNDITGEITVLWSGATLEEWYVWADNEEDLFDSIFRVEQPVYTLYAYSIVMHGGTERLFWELMALVYLDVCSPNALKELGDEGFSISLNNNRINSYFEKVISWDDTQYSLGWGNDWDKTPPLALLMHEIAHAWDDYHGYGLQNKWNTVDSENYAISWENRARNCFYWNVPGYDDLFPSKKYERSFESWNMPNSDAWIWGDAPGRGWAWDVYNWLW